MAHELGDISLPIDVLDHQIVVTDFAIVLEVDLFRFILDTSPESRST